MTKPAKPMGAKCYGSIPHLPGSRLGPGDHKIHDAKYVRPDKVDDRYVRNEEELMTCEEFRAFTSANQSPHKCTVAETAAVFAHAIRCKLCWDFVDGLAKTTPESMEANREHRRKCMADPEFIEAIGLGKNLPDSRASGGRNL